MADLNIGDRVMTRYDSNKLSHITARTGTIVEIVPSWAFTQYQVKLDVPAMYDGEPVLIAWASEDEIVDAL